MALEETVDSLEGINEQYHDLYVENEDGKFEINITGLKSALTKERISRKKLEKKLSDEGKPPATDDELQKQLKEANDKIKNLQINTKVKSVAIASGIDKDYVDDVITLTKGNFGLDADGEVIVINADGEPTGKSLDNYFAVDFKRAKPRLYNSTGRQGSGAQGNLSGQPMSYNSRMEKAIKDKDLKTLIKLKHNKGR